MTKKKSRIDGSLRGSSAGVVLRSMSPRTRERLRIPDMAITMWDGVVAVSRAVVDDTSSEPVMDRISQALASLDQDVDTDQITPLLVEFERQMREVQETGQFPEWLRQIKRNGFAAYAERVLGAGAYSRLRNALNDDVAVVSPAVRRAMDFLMPYVLAFNDVLTQALSPARREEADVDIDGVQSIVGLLVRVDQGLDRIGSAAGRKSLTADVLTDFPAPTVDQMGRVVQMARSQLDVKTSALADEFGDRVSRKFRGARQALAMSPDPVSQAANSMIELIDRLLRSAFTSDEVIGWLAEHYDRYDTDTELTYIDKGKLKPTTRARCLCYLHAGQAPTDDTAFNTLLADAVVAARRSLQGLKHADEGTIEELDQIAQLIYAVEGALLLHARLVLRRMPADVVDPLLDRIDGPKAAEARRSQTA